MPRPKPFQNLYDHDHHRLRDVLRWKLGWARKESARVDVSSAQEARPRLFVPDWARISHPDPRALQVTWIGHATFLIQLSGENWLTDPVYATYCAPVPLPACRRLFPPALAWERLPRIDGVLLSHAHYDHMDRATLDRLDKSTPIFVPQGLRGWFRRRGFGEVHELTWWQSARTRTGLTVHACPVQHFSARKPWDWNRTLWCGWVVAATDWKVFFAGDTGYCPVFREIGRKFPGLDLAILPIGAYAPRWLMQSMHGDPFEAAQMHLDLGTRYSVPGHWGTFPLTDEPPGEPAVLLAQAREQHHISPDRFPLLQPGQTLSIARPFPPGP